MKILSNFGNKFRVGFDNEADLNAPYEEALGSAGPLTSSLIKHVFDIKRISGALLESGNAYIRSTVKFVKAGETLPGFDTAWRRQYFTQGEVYWITLSSNPTGICHLQFMDNPVTGDHRLMEEDRLNLLIQAQNASPQVLVDGRCYGVLSDTLIKGSVATKEGFKLILSVNIF